MVYVFQCPSLHLRGSISTQTMSNLAPEQILEVEKVVKFVVNDASLKGDRMEFTKQLGVTIKGDYKSDKLAAEQEFTIAIWRATVHLLFHHDYSYECSECKNVAYKTKEKRTKQMDRQYKVCPCCKKTKYNGQITTYDDDTNSITVGGSKVEFKDKTSAEKELESIVSVVHGGKKIDNPYDIINDPSQRNQYYSVWCWNYFRQIINENKIETHGKTRQLAYGPADHILIKVIESELKTLRCKFHTNEASNEIYFNVLHTPIELTSKLVELKKKYEQYNIALEGSDSGLAVKSLTKRIPMIDDYIMSNDTVSSVSFGTNATNDNDDSSISDVLEAQVVVKSDNLSIGVDQSDLLAVMFRKLNKYDNITKSNCKRVIQILSQNGEEWDIYSDECGEKISKSGLADYLGVSPKKVVEYKSIIEDVCNQVNLKDLVMSA